MLKRIIRSLRGKSKGVRNNIAFGAASMITLVVFAGWQYFGAASNPLVIQTETREESVGFSNFFDRIGEQAAAVKEAFEEISTSTESTVTADSQESNDSQRAASLSSIEVEAQARMLLGDKVSDGASSTVSSPKPVRIVTVQSTTSSSTNGQ